MAKIMTEKQKKLVMLISENLSNQGLTKSMYAMMKEAGYSESMARRQSGIKDSETVQEAIDPIIKAMLKERDAAIVRMAQIRSKAKYRDLTDAIDKLTKNVQLLSGKPTDKIDNAIHIYIPERK